MQVTALLDRLSGVKQLRDGSWMALCPCHPDHNPSLHITEKDGQLLVYCFACKATLKDVLRAVGLNHTPTAEPCAFYDYTDEEGNLLYQVVRFYPKDFRCRRPLPGGGFAWDLQGVRRVLYNLPAVVKADTVYIVEGEKDADRLIREGVVATTAPGGAGKWDESFSECLKGKNIIIIPDNDEPGQKHAELVALSVWRYAKSVKIVKLYDVPPKGDVSDFLVKHSFDELLKLVNETPEWTPGPIRQADVEVRGPSARIFFPEVSVTIFCQKLKLHSDGRLTGLFKVKVGNHTIPGAGVLNLAAPGTRRQYAKQLESYVSLDWEHILDKTYNLLLERLQSGEPVRPLRPQSTTTTQYVVAGFLPAGLETLLWGAGGAGKSWLALALAIHIATGEHFLDRKIITPGRTLYLDWETNYAEFARRLSMILGKEDSDLFDEDFLFYKRMDVPLADSLDYLYEVVTEINPVLIIIDSMARAAGGRLLEEEAISQFFAAVRSLGRTTLIIHHPTKAVLTKTSDEDPASTFYGSAYTMWLPRSVWRLDAHYDPETDVIKGILTHVKTNIGRKQPPIAFLMRLEPFSLESVPIGKVKEEIPLRTRILDLLSRRGKMTVTQLASELEESPETVRRVLNRMKRKGQVEKDIEEGAWYVPAEIPF